MAQNLLQEPLRLSPEQIAFYRQNNYIKIKQVFDPELLEHYNQVLTRVVEAQNLQTQPLEERSTYGKAFLQLFNLWTQDPQVRELVFSKRLASLAAQLMEVEGVRLYHDQALFKEGGGGITPWHADQHYWPLASDKTITVWIPLQTTPLEMGPLEFSAGSQRIQAGRELSIGDESERVIQSNLKINHFEHVIEPFDAGEVSFHSGWVFHRAGANQSQTTRKVFTIIYMDQAMVLKQPENSGQENDARTWCPGVAVGSVVNSPLNPVLFP